MSDTESSPLARHMSISLETYLEEVEGLGREAADREIGAIDYLPQLDRNHLNDLAEFRAALLTESDRSEYAGLLHTGLFNWLDGDQRLGLIVVGAEVDTASSDFELTRQCEAYRDDQYLFKHEPELFRGVSASGREDLVDLDTLTPLPGYAAFKTKNGYARLSRLLSPQIVRWAKAHYPKAKSFIRLDPHRFYQQQPRIMLNEMTIRPANPRWFANLTLRSGMEDGAQYDLEPGELPGDKKRYWEYHIRKIRRLEFASRRKGSYLSMMLEELPDLHTDRELIAAQCVHLDTEDPAGTPFEKVIMKHLDLAVNVYGGEDKTRRCESRLFEAKVTDATFRTHLLRIQDVPMTSAFSFGRMFFRSETLLDELIEGLAIPSTSSV